MDVTPRAATDADLESRATAAVAAVVASPAALAEARWSGLAGRAVESVRLIDAFAPPDGGGGLAVAELALAGDGASAWLTVPLAAESGLQATWAWLHGLAIAGGAALGVRGGRLAGRPEGAPRRLGGTAGASIRLSPGDQSHTSVIVDEAAILKLYRRLTPGPNPEAELLAALAGVPDAPVPEWHGSVELEAAGGSTTVAVAQRWEPHVPDAFELMADALAAELSGGARPDPAEPGSMAGPVALCRAVGVATGRLHGILAGLDLAGFGTRLAGPADRATWLARADAAVDRAIEAVRPPDPALADRLEASSPAIRRALEPLGDPAPPVRLQRIHGDLHLGQVLATPDGVLLIDFEGDPTREPESRRELDAPLRDIAGFLRSIDHVARSGRRRAASRSELGSRADAARIAARIDAWIEAAGSAFLEGFRSGLGRPGWRPDAALLRAAELEKELGELIYAATYLPGWLYAPTEGLRALLGEPPDAGVPGAGR